MFPILVFDLDDTLYEERTYVESGFRAVAAFGEQRFGWDREASFAFMIGMLAREGRGTVFDRWLAAHGRAGEGLVRECVRAYRHHEPAIALREEARTVLDRYRDHPLYLVTDGHKIVQDRKVKALGIEDRFRKVFITHRYGLASAKPSIHCFERIRARESCTWPQMVHIADNPAKDFVNLRKLGMHTVRVLTGEHKDRVAKPGADAEYRIDTIAELPRVLESLAAHGPNQEK